MKANYEDLVIDLKNKNIRLSHQRLKVLEYMNNNRVHPTVDQIYTDLHKEIPTLSKTTIYNTLNVLVEAGLVNALTIGDNETKYDMVNDNHGHFKCESCGNIFDFHINMDSVESEGLNDFEIHKKDINLLGLCPACLENKN